MAGQVLLLTLMLLPWLAPSAPAAVLPVPAGYLTIQAALDASAPGDTVLVAPGTYHELLIVPPQDITLASRYLFTGGTLDIVGTVLDGQLAGTVITVTPGEQVFHLNGFIVTGGWGGTIADGRGGGLWIQPGANVDIRNTVFTGNGTESPDGMGAAIMGGLIWWDAGAIRLRNVQITDNNHLPESGTAPISPSFCVSSNRKVEISNLFCNGAGLDDAAIFVGTTDSLFADSIRVTGYRANGGNVSDFRGLLYTDINHIQVVDNHSCGAKLMNLIAQGRDEEPGYLRVRDLVIEQNSDTCENPSSWDQVYLACDYLDADGVSITRNWISTRYLLNAFAFKEGIIRDLVVENNTMGSEVEFLSGITGSVAYFTNTSLDSARFHRNTAHLPSGQNHDYGACSLLRGSYFWTDNQDIDSMTWRNVSFRDNWIYDHTNPATNHYGLVGRTVNFSGFACGTFLFENCEWVNNRVNMIAPEVDLFPGPRNVGSTVELQGDFREVGTSVIFNNCLFQDNDDGGLYAADIGSGILQNCRFLRNNRFAAWFYSNNDDAFVTVRNTWFHGTNMQEYHLPYPQYQGIFHIHGFSGALIENVTASACSTSFAISVGVEDQGATIIKSSVFWDLSYEDFIHVWDGLEQEGDFTYCISGEQLPGEGNLELDPAFDPDLGPPYLSPLSLAIDAGDPSPVCNDIEDLANPGFALWPSRGTLRNDIGVTGGPFAMAPDTAWATLIQPWEPRTQPNDFLLGAPWPNPFNPVTRIPFTLLRPTIVKLSVHNLLGQEVAVLAHGLRLSGTHQVAFDGGRLASGLYLVTLEVAGRTETRAVTQLR